MMEFFRKYQRSFFLVITTMVIASFLFFGAFSSYENQVEVPDQLLTQAVDGSKIMKREVQQLARFLATDRQDPPGKNTLPPNFCNDGVIRFDLIQTGLADLLVSNYFDPMRGALASRLERVKRFRPYTHPSASFLNASAVWDRFVPGMNQAILALQSESEVGPKTFRQLFQLYELESRCPSEWMRKILLYQQQQYEWLKNDLSLQNADLSLFGFHSTIDWFGSDFVDLCAEFILNAARWAEQKGYLVSLEEAKADLIHHFTSTIEQIQQANPGVNSADFNFHFHLRSLGFDEKSAATVWRNVLLFRRYFQGVGESAFIDRLPYSDFASYALETALVELYQWPRPLRLKTFSDLIQFQFYVEAISKNKDPLAIPSELLPLEEIEAHFPELVQRTFSAQIGKVSKEEIGLRASVKEVWEWQLDEKNWEYLRNKFSFLPLLASRDEKFKALEALPFPQRNQIDGLTRRMLVDLHPEWVEAAFGSVEKREEISISSASCSLRHIENMEKFAASLEAAASTRSSFRYSDDERTYYQLSEVEKVQDKHLLTFEKAKAQGILSSLVQSKLQKAYPDLRAQFPEKFKAEEGKWKPFSEVKDLVASYVYADLLKAIDRDGKGEASPSLESYAKRRLLPQTQMTWAHLRDHPTDPRWIQNGSDDPLIEQFKMEKKEEQIQRIAKEEWMKEEAFTMLPDQWSSIHLAPDGEIVFFYFKERKPHQVPILEQLVLGKETIAADAQRFLAERFIEELKRKQSIVVPIRGETK